MERKDIEQIVIEEAKREYGIAQSQDNNLTEAEFNQEFKQIVDRYIINQLNSAIHYAKQGFTSGSALYMDEMQRQIMKEVNFVELLKRYSEEDVLQTFAEKYGVTYRIPTNNEKEELEDKLGKTVSSDQSSWYFYQMQYSTAKFLRGDGMDSLISKKNSYSEFIKPVLSQIQYRTSNPQVGDNIDILQQAQNINCSNYDSQSISAARSY